jgi:hypothetical protein
VRPYRILPILAWVAFAVGTLWVVEAGGRRGTGGFVAGSVFNPTPEGLSVAYRYLGERSRPGAHVSTPVVLGERARGDNLPAGGVLFRLRPLRSPQPPAPGDEGDRRSRPLRPRTPRPLLSAAEDAWVRAGGRLVLGLASSYGPLVLKPGRPGPPVRKVFPIWQGVRRLEPAAAVPQISGTPVDEAHAVFVSGETPVLSRIPRGRGDVILLLAPELIENGRLPRVDHLRLLEALAGVDRPVVFDEWVHGLGHEGGLLERLLAWGFGPALVGGLLAFALALWRGRSRLGPEEMEPPDARSEAVDLVESLGQLYERALSRREAAVLHVQSFRRAVALRTGLAGAALERRCREVLGESLPPLPAAGEIPAAEFSRRLHIINDGYRRLDEHARTRRRT